MAIKKTRLTPINLRHREMAHDRAQGQAMIRAVLNHKFCYRIQTIIWRYCLFTAICGGISEMAVNPNRV